MKITLLFGVLYLLAAFGGSLALGEQPHWLKQLSSELDLMQKNIEFNAQRMQQDGEAELKNTYAELDRIKQKCANKGITEGTENTFQNDQPWKRVGISIQENNGIRHFSERTVNPVTKKIEEKHYSIDLNNPNAEPIC